MWAIDLCEMLTCMEGGEGELVGWVSGKRGDCWTEWETGQENDEFERCR